MQRAVVQIDIVSSILLDRILLLIVRSCEHGAELGHGGERLISRKERRVDGALGVLSVSVESARRIRILVAVRQARGVLLGVVRTQNTVGCSLLRSGRGSSVRLVGSCVTVIEATSCNPVAAMRHHVDVDVAWSWLGGFAKSLEKFVNGLTEIADFLFVEDDLLLEIADLVVETVGLLLHKAALRCNLSDDVLHHRRGRSMLLLDLQLGRQLLKVCE